MTRDIRDVWEIYVWEKNTYISENGAFRGWLEFVLFLDRALEYLLSVLFVFPISSLQLKEKKKVTIRQNPETEMNSDDDEKYFLNRGSKK